MLETCHHPKVISSGTEPIRQIQEGLERSVAGYFKNGAELQRFRQEMSPFRSVYPKEGHQLK